MGIKIEKFTVSTKGFNDLIEITSKVQNIVSISNASNALLNVTVVASTASILTIEYEPGIAFDLTKFFENLVPINKIYQHDNNWHDGNAFSHLRASLVGNSITLPIIDGKIELNDYQQIVLIDFDNKPRTRNVVVSILD